MAFHNKKYVGLCDILQIAFGAVLLVCEFIYKVN